MEYKTDGEILPFRKLQVKNKAPLLFLILSWVQTFSQADFYSNASGNWVTAATWSLDGADADGIPDADDNVIISAGHTITMNGNPANCNSLLINGTANWTAARQLNIGTGGLTMQGGTITGTRTGTIIVSGNFNVGSGTSDLGRCNLTVTGNTVINGQLNITNTTGIRSFNNITINTGGTWNAAVAESFAVAGDLVNSGTFTSNTGIYNFSGTGKVFSGSMDIARATIDGTYTNSNSLSVNTALSGTGTLTQAIGSVLTIGGTSALSNIAAGTSINTVTYNGAAGQTIVAGAYYDLEINKPSGIIATQGGDVTVANQLNITSGTMRTGGNSLSVSGNTNVTGIFQPNNTGGTKTFNHIFINSGGTWTNSAAETYSISGNMTMTNGTINGNAAAIFNITGWLLFTTGTTNTIGRCDFNVTGTTTVTGTVVFNSTQGNKSFSDLIINSAGHWNPTSASPFFISGNLQNNGTFTSNTGTYTFTGVNKTISGSAALSINSFSVTGTVTNQNNLTVSASLEGSGTYSQGASGTLNIGTTDNNFSVTTFNASASGNTVNYVRAGNQTIRIPDDGSYSNLSLSVSNTKTLSGNTAVTGNLSIAAATLDATTSNFAINLSGNWDNTGTFNARSATVTLVGTGIQTITNATGETFYNLSISGSSTKVLGGPVTVGNDLVINSSLDVSASDYALTVRRNWLNNGSFLSQSGTVTFNGTVSQSIGGSSSTSFSNLTVSNTTGVSITTDQSLKGTLTLSAGTFTTSGFNFTLISDASGAARIGPIAGGADLAGNITMQRYLPAGPTGWRFLGSPVSGRTLADWLDDFAMSGFTGSTSPSMNFKSIYTYNESATGSWSNGYVPASNITNPVTAGIGYWAYVGPVPVTLDVSGPPVKFNQSLTLSYTSSAGQIDDGWNMVANPYPSQIDWDDPSWTKTNIDNAIYIWNPSLQQYASYVAGIGINGASNIIPSSQAFWVKANAVSPALSLTENVKSNGSQAFIRTKNTNNPNHSLRLTIRGNNYQDETYIQFSAGASPAFEADKDAYKLHSNTAGVPSVSTLAGTKELSINTLGELKSDVTIPVKVKVTKPGNYTLERDSLLRMPLSSCIILEDLHAGKTIDLRSTPAYSFFISDTTSTARFLLKTSGAVEKESRPVSCNGESNGLIIAKGSGPGPWSYEWKNTSGTVLRSASQVTAADSLKGLNAGIYSVKITDPSSLCGNYTDTIIVSEPSALSLSAVTSNVKCYGESNGAIQIIAGGGTPLYTYNWSNGMKTEDIAYLPAGTYFLTVADQNSCTHTEAFIITQPAPMTVSFTLSPDTIYLSNPGEVHISNTSQGVLNYTWDYGDGSAAGTSANPLPHSYEAAGIYILKLTGDNGSCYDSLTKKIVVINDTLATLVNDLSGINVFRLEKEDGKLYLNIRSDKSDDVLISVYDPIGKKIIEDIKTNHLSGRIYIPLPENPSGQFYILRFSMAEDQYSCKIIH